MTSPASSILSTTPSRRTPTRSPLRGEIANPLLPHLSADARDRARTVPTESSSSVLLEGVQPVEVLAVPRSPCCPTSRATMSSSSAPTTRPNSAGSSLGNRHRQWPPSSAGRRRRAGDRRRPAAGAAGPGGFAGSGEPLMQAIMHRSARRRQSEPSAAARRAEATRPAPRRPCAADRTGGTTANAPAGIAAGRTGTSGTASGAAPPRAIRQPGIR